MRRVAMQIAGIFDVYSDHVELCGLGEKSQITDAIVRAFDLVVLMANYVPQRRGETVVHGLFIFVYG